MNNLSEDIKNEKESSFKEDIGIDKFRLDYEWLRQPELYYKWAKLCAEAGAEKDKAKEQLDIIKSKIDSDIRINPKDYGFDKKPTETAIASVITQNPNYRKAYNYLTECSKDEKIMKAASIAFEHKKKALENFVELWSKGYFADPKISKEAKEKVEEIPKENIRKKLNEKNGRLSKRRKKQ